MFRLGKMSSRSMEFRWDAVQEQDCACMYIGVTCGKKTLLITKNHGSPRFTWHCYSSMQPSVYWAWDHVALIYQMHVSKAILGYLPTRIATFHDKHYEGTTFLRDGTEVITSIYIRSMHLYSFHSSLVFLAFTVREPLIRHQPTAHCCVSHMHTYETFSSASPLTRINR